MLEVEDLAADHPRGADRGRDQVHRLQPPFRRRRGRLAAQDFEGPVQQGVAGEHRHRLSASAVQGRAAAAQIVVVQGRQVVVNQAERVDHLEGRGARQQLFPGAPPGFAGEHDQSRAHPLAAREHAVAHGVVNLLRRGLRGRQQPVERRVDLRPEGGEEGGKVVHASGARSPSSAASGTTSAAGRASAASMTGTSLTTG